MGGISDGLHYNKTITKATKEGDFNMPTIEFYLKGEKLLSTRGWTKPSNQDRDIVTIKDEKYYVTMVELVYGDDGALTMKVQLRK